MDNQIELNMHNGVAELWLNRPALRNALDAEVIAQLAARLAELAADPPRVLVLGGRGAVFCSGADLSYMRASVSFSTRQNLDDAARLAELFAQLNSCPCPVVARVQRGAYGGALGLIACCDYTICTSDCSFAFPEVRVGIAPATIAPYVIAKIGTGHAAALWLSGQRFDAAQAQRIGLVHEVVDPEALDAALERRISEFLQAGPQAARATKRLIQQLRPAVTAETRRLTAELIATLRASDEGQQGLAAALEKRPAPWQPIAPKQG
jgi:methylglutaconyl-CoA hydratase